MVGKHHHRHRKKRGGGITFRLKNEPDAATCQSRESPNLHQYMLIENTSP